MSRFGYRGYGLSLLSEIELPEYLPAPLPEAPDIRIRLDSAARAAWAAAEGPEGAFLATPAGGHAFKVPEVAAYHVRDGSEIRIAPEPDSDPGLVRLFVIGSAMGMALHQRGALVLHGAAVAKEGRALILVGDSGAGKSTLAARLGRAGCTVFGDDTMAVWDGPGGRGKWLWPGSRVFKLWSESLSDLGIDSEGLTRLGNRTDKYYVPNPTPAAEEGAALAEILVLETGEGAPRVEPIEGLKALEAVARNTYRPEYVGLMGREAPHFGQCAELIREAPVARLIRPWDLARIGETVELVLDRLAQMTDAEGPVLQGRGQ